MTCVGMFIKLRGIAMEPAIIMARPSSANRSTLACRHRRSCVSYGTTTKLFFVLFTIVRIFQKVLPVGQSCIFSWETSPYLEYTYLLRIIWHLDHSSEAYERLGVDFLRTLTRTKSPDTTDSAIGRGSPLRSTALGNDLRSRSHRCREERILVFH